MFLEMPGDSGWDVFSLKYHVDAPINAVISQQHLALYHKLFAFLWRLRRVEYTLSNTWCRNMTASHALSVGDVVRVVLRQLNFILALTLSTDS